MSRTVVVLGFAVLLSVAILWAVGIAVVSVRHWHDTHTRIEATRDAAKQDCLERYYDHDAKLRCQHLHDVKFVTDINIAKATRAVIAAGPTVLLLIVAMLTWRSDKARNTQRVTRARSAGRSRTAQNPATRSSA